MCNRSIVFINQSSGYLMIDIINAHVPYYDEIFLLTGFFNPRAKMLDPKVKVKLLKKYNRKSNITKLFSWIIFHFQSLFYIFFIYRKSKLYFVSNPPINVFSPKILQRDYAYLIYDLYPQVFLINNLLESSSILFRFWIYMNKKMFKNAKYIFTISQGMKNQLNYFSKHEKVKVVPIWTHSNFFDKIPESENIFLRDNQIKAKFIVGYCGNLGKTHPLEKIISIAEFLKSYEDIYFLVIGEGEKKSMLKKLKKEKLLTNLEILDFQDTKVFSHVLAAFHIGVVTLEINAKNLSVPSKTFDLMSAGKPILGISAKDSELSSLINKNNIGQNFEQSTDVKEISDFILKLKNEHKQYEALCINSKRNSHKFTYLNAKRLILK